jgi:hypothetical protein
MPAIETGQADRNPEIPHSFACRWEGCDGKKRPERRNQKARTRPNSNSEFHGVLLPISCFLILQRKINHESAREENIGAGSGQSNYPCVWVPRFKVLSRPLCERFAHSVFLFHCRSLILCSWLVLLELLIQWEWNRKDGKHRGMDVRVFRFLAL